MTSFCSRCGAALTHEARFCASCGAPATQLSAQPAFERPVVVPVVVTAAKSKTAAALLAFFLGPLGIHNFYLGYNGRGLAQLLVTVLTCGLGALVTGVWAGIELIMLLTGSIDRDASGVQLV